MNSSVHEISVPEDEPIAGQQRGIVNNSADVEVPVDEPAERREFPQITRRKPDTEPLVCKLLVVLEFGPDITIWAYRVLILSRKPPTIGDSGGNRAFPTAQVGVTAKGL